VTQEPVLSVRNLSRTYSTGKGIVSAGFTVGAGEVVALVGPNGAGKTTLLEALCGTADYVGSVRIAGFDREHEAHQRQNRVCLPERRNLPLFLSGVAAARLAEGFWDQPGLFSRFVTEAHFWGLEGGDLEQPALALSQGMREKLMLALVFSSTAALMILDEPEAHLDPIVRHRLEQRLVARRDQGGALLLATHDAYMAARLADRILIVRAGRLHNLGAVPGVEAVFDALETSTEGDA